jgi:hypothetical protein
VLLRGAVMLSAVKSFRYSYTIVQPGEGGFLFSPNREFGA